MHSVWFPIHVCVSVPSAECHFHESSLLKLIYRKRAFSVKDPSYAYMEQSFIILDILEQGFSNVSRHKNHLLTRNS